MISHTNPSMRGHVRTAALALPAALFLTVMPDAPAGAYVAPHGVGLEGSAHPTAFVAQDEPKKVPPRYGFVYNPGLYPQKKPQDAIQSVIKAIDAKHVDYLLAQLAEPKFIDAQVAEYKASGAKGDEEARTYVAFRRLVADTVDYFVGDPLLVKELRLFARDAKWEIDEGVATGTLKGSPRKVFLKQIGDRWFLENRQQ